MPEFPECARHCMQAGNSVSLVCMFALKQHKQSVGSPGILIWHVDHRIGVPLSCSCEKDCHSHRQLCGHVPDSPIFPLAISSEDSGWMRGPAAEVSGAATVDPAHMWVLSCQPAGNSFPAQLWKQLICDFLRRGENTGQGKEGPGYVNIFSCTKPQPPSSSRVWEKKGLLASGSGTCGAVGAPVGCLQLEGGYCLPSKSFSAGVWYCPAWPTCSLVPPTARDVLLDHQELAWVTCLDLLSHFLV